MEDIKKSEAVLHLRDSLDTQLYIYETKVHVHNTKKIFTTTETHPEKLATWGQTVNTAGLVHK